MSMIDEAIIKSFQSISLEEMGKVRLMNRIDTKFVTSFDKIEDFLEITSGDYMLQQIGGHSNMPYYTKYYDTADVNMFYQHQRGKKNRQKIRIRQYENSDTPPFLEIKTKNNKGRTRKKRVVMEEDTLLAQYTDFINRHSIYDPAQLFPRIENHFYRVTLVDKHLTERITIDTHIEFHNLLNDNRVSLPNIGVIEWKRDGRNCKSDLDSLLRELRIHPNGFSKYCVGMAMTDSALKQNRLKVKLRTIDRINSGF
ncbi:MAG: polyphosphate polymerase domain-containing protein [Paramuribaculum sp.]|nr:polyphosphate polymerase domain-containing protein [Paramuribaculum sp.]